MLVRDLAASKPHLPHMEATRTLNADNKPSRAKLDTTTTSYLQDRIKDLVSTRSDRGSDGSRTDLERVTRDVARQRAAQEGHRARGRGARQEEAGGCGEDAICREQIFPWCQMSIVFVHNYKRSRRQKRLGCLRRRNFGMRQNGQHSTAFGA